MLKILIQYFYTFNKNKIRTKYVEIVLDQYPTLFNNIIQGHELGKVLDKVINIKENRRTLNKKFRTVEVKNKSIRLNTILKYFFFG